MEHRAGVDQRKAETKAAAKVTNYLYRALSTDRSLTVDIDGPNTRASRSSSCRYEDNTSFLWRHLTQHRVLIIAAVHDDGDD